MNERVDHTNYEAWLLDRLEGNLTPDQERELDAFLLDHPHLVPVDDVLPSVSAIDAALSGMEKEALKKRVPPIGSVDGHSVETHLIARLEGDLGPDQLNALRIYLADHPEHQRAERIYALTKLVPEAMAYAAKRELQRQIPPQGMPSAFDLDDFLIARMEGDLSGEQVAALERLIAQNAEHQQAWKMMRATRSSATPIVFAGKEGLKKREGRVIPFTFGSWAVRLAAAASVALLIGIGLWFLRTPDVHEREIARVPVKTVEPERNVPEQGSPESGARKSVVEPRVDEQNGQPPAREQRIDIPAPQKARPANAIPATPAEEPVLAHDAPAPVRVQHEEPLVPSPQEEQNEVNGALAAAVPAHAASASTGNSTTLGELLATTVRDRVLDKPVREAQTLDGDDAVAMVDRTLKAVGGDRAGLDVGRKANDGTRRFDLRLGRNFSISASR